MRIVLSILLCLLASPLGAMELGQPDAWFAATFDGSIYLTVETASGACGGTELEDCWFWNFRDNDNSGFHWRGDLWFGVMDCAPPADDHPKGLTVVEGTNDPYTDFFDVQLVQVDAAHGLSLFMEMSQDDTGSTTSTARLQYKCYENQAEALPQFDTGYMAYDFYLQDDLETQNCVGDQCWRYGLDMWEEFGEDPTYDNARIEVKIRRWKPGTDRWEWKIAHAAHRISDGAWVDIWGEVDVSEAANGVWQRVEIEWVGDTTNGSLKLWLDGVLILSKTSAQTLYSGNGYRWADMFRLYTNSYIDDDTNPSPSWQYIDNLVICGSRAECG